MLKEKVNSSIRLANVFDSLNPYFNGTCSKSIKFMPEDPQLKLCLNPYFNGTCSKRTRKQFVVYCERHGLNPYFNGTCSKRAFFIRPSVLICYIEIFTLINAFASEKCTCFLLKSLQR